MVFAPKGYTDLVLDLSQWKSTRRVRQTASAPLRKQGKQNTAIFLFSFSSHGGCTGAVNEWVPNACRCRVLDQVLEAKCDKSCSEGGRRDDIQKGWKERGWGDQHLWIETAQHNLNADWQHVKTAPILALQLLEIVPYAQRRSIKWRKGYIMRKTVSLLIFPFPRCCKTTICNCCFTDSL